jgi:hypothetical protein
MATSSDRSSVDVTAPPAPPSPMQLDPPPASSVTTLPPSSFPPEVPESSSSEYIRTQYHPHACKVDDIEYLDGSVPSKATSSTSEELGLDTAEAILRNLPYQRPWAPFRSRADFEVAELATKLLAKGDALADLIRGTGPPRLDKTLDIPGYQHPLHWHDESKVTFSSVKDFDEIMARARTYVLEVSLLRAGWINLS